jgi:hypothetical protein
MCWRVLELDVGQDVFLARLADGTIEIEVCADIQLEGRRALLRSLHVYGPGPNSVGARLRSLALWVKDSLDVDELRIEGATRATGASPGRKPTPLVF